jgi:trigger factor
LREQYQNISKRRVRLGLLLTHVGETNDLTVTQEEINRAIMEQARQMPGQEQQFVEFYRSNPEAQASLRAPIFEDKVVNYIIEMATVTERVLSPEELRAETEQNTLEKPVKESKKTTAKKKNIKSNKANTKSENKKTTKKRVSKPKT